MVVEYIAELSGDLICEGPIRERKAVQRTREEGGTRESTMASLTSPALRATESLAPQLVTPTRDRIHLFRPHSLLQAFYGKEKLGLCSKRHHESRRAENEAGNPYAAQRGHGSPYSDKEYNIFDLVVAFIEKPVVFYLDPHVQSPCGECDDRDELDQNAHNDAAL